jgi:formiminotetrahydrofolate cyclodeaminase
MADPARLDELTLRDLIDRLATRDPIPGGGSAAAVAGAMAAALVGMVVELSVGRPAHEADAEELGRIGATAATRRAELLDLADLDAAAYGAVVTARRLPRETDEQRGLRAERIVDATRQATLVPLRTAQAASEVLDLAARIAPIGNPNAASDAGVAARLAAAAADGAALNVRINLPFLPADDPLRHRVPAELAAVTDSLAEREGAVLAAVAKRIEPGGAA